MMARRHPRERRITLALDDPHLSRRNVDGYFSANGRFPARHACGGRGRGGNPSSVRGDQPMTNRPCIHGWKAQRKYRIEPDGAVSVAPID
jgi:hypothetical protein